MCTRHFLTFFFFLFVLEFVKLSSLWLVLYILQWTFCVPWTRSVEPKSPKQTSPRVSRPRPNQKDDKLQQLQIDAGQKDLEAFTCETCLMVYVPGDEDDYRQHEKFHADAVKVLKLPVSWFFLPSNRLKVQLVEIRTCWKVSLDGYREYRQIQKWSFKFEW